MGDQEVICADLVCAECVSESMLTGVKYPELERRVGNMNYPVGDFLIRIKNASLAKKRQVKVVNTKLISLVAHALKKQGYLREVTEKDGKLVAFLSYRRKQPLIMEVRLVSKPGLRVYKGANELEKIKKPTTLIISTPKGVMSSQEAIKKRLGGEVIVEML